MSRGMSSLLREVIIGGFGSVAVDEPRMLTMRWIHRRRSIAILKRRRFYWNFLLGRIRTVTHRNVVDGQVLSLSPHFSPVQELRPRTNPSRCNPFRSNAKERTWSRPKAFHRARRFLSRNFVLISMCARIERNHGKFRCNAQRSSYDHVARNSVIRYLISALPENFCIFSARLTLA